MSMSQKLKKVHASIDRKMVTGEQQTRLGKSDFLFDFFSPKRFSQCEKKAVTKTSEEAKLDGLMNFFLPFLVLISQSKQ